MPYVMDTMYPSAAVKLSVGYLGWHIGENSKAETEAERRRRYEIGTDGIANGLRRLTKEELPDALVLRKTRRKADIDDYDNPVMVSLGQAFFARSDFKELIEELDGRAHQFIEMPILNRDLKQIKGTWFLVNVMARQKTLVVEKSEVYAHPTMPEKGLMVQNNSKLTLDESKLSNLSLWREENVLNTLFVSDQLKYLMKSRGIKFPKLHKTKALN